MAAPPEKTIKNLSGKWTMNKTLSDEHDPILVLQGVGWITRKAIGAATITLVVKQYEEAGKTHIDIEQIVTGGFKGTTEKRVLDYEEGEHEDQVFGKVRGRSRFIKTAEAEDPFLKEKWLPETADGEAIESNVTSVTNGWVAKQVWGFQEVKGERRWARQVVVTKGSERKQATLVYDYVSG